MTPHCYISISGLSEYDTGHVLRISCLGCRRLACAAGGSINCKAQKQTLADARRRRHEARQREQQEFDGAESDLAGFALILSDQADPPCRIVEARRLLIGRGCGAQLQKRSFGTPAVNVLRQC